MPELVIRGARIRGAQGIVDVAVDDGVVSEVSPHIGGQAQNEIPAGGRLLAPGFVNIHCHLDKCLTSTWARVWDESRSGAPQAIPGATDIKRGFNETDIVERATRALNSSVLLGTTAVRAFADVDSVGGLLAVKSLLKVRQRFKGIADVQVVAFPQEGIVRDEGTEELLERAVELGADVIGAMPWYEKSHEASKKHLDVTFSLARKYDRDIHALIDDNSDPNSRNIEYLLVKATGEGMKGRVAASHCRGGLDSPDEDYARRIYGLAKEAGLTVVENPHVSLFMYGRSDPHPVRRGVTRVKEFLREGVNVAIGQDDMDDPYYPFGRGDMLELAWLMCHAAHLGSLGEMESSFDMVTYNAAKGMRLPKYGVEVGDYADLVLLDAGSVHETLRLQPDRTAVLKRGRLVAETKSRRILYS